MKVLTIAITRPKEGLSSAVKLATSYKFKTIAVPFIEVREKKDKQFPIFLKKLLNGEVDYVIFTSTNGSDILTEGLKKLSAKVHEIRVYSIALPKNLERQRKLIEKALRGRIDIFTFTSTQTVVNFLKVADKNKEKIIKILNEKITACIGMPTKKILEENGIKVKVMPKEFTFEEMIKEIHKYVKNNSLYA